MPDKITTVDAYLAAISEDRQAAVKKLRETVLAHLPGGFSETMSYDMIGYVVPHDRYPDGYHCDPKQPLPFAGIANRKGHIALYHMGMYAEPSLLEWFTAEYPKHSPRKLDMGKSCVRFKKPEHIPYDLIGQLFERMSVDEWIEVYEQGLKKS